jgi:hypothetical protein
MLRALVLLLLLVNGVLAWWLQSDPHALQADREPQRLGRQVAPDAIQVLPDLAASGARGAATGASTAASAASSAAQGASASAVDVALVTGGPASEAASAVPVALPRKIGDADADCAETPPIDDAQFASLKAALIKSGVAADAVGERRQTQGGTWIVYLGRFADAQTWQQKADELAKLDVKFDRVNAPATLAPGLSLGPFSSQPDAAKKLDELGRHGVHGAKVVTLTAPVVQRHLQVRAADPAWHHATGAQRFNSCPAQAPSSA